MRWRRLFSLVAMNLRASRTSAAFAIVGIAVGICLLTFFVGLGEGLRERVLNRIFPANQVEFEPRAVNLFGVHDSVGQAPLDDVGVARLAALKGVERAWGKQKSAFPAKLWGGQSLLGYDLRAEAFLDGMPASLLSAELHRGEAESTPPRTPGDPLERCDVDIDCEAGARCVEGVCEAIVWADRFRDDALHLDCDKADDCASGLACFHGNCQTTCDSAHPCGEKHGCSQLKCASDNECPQGACADGQCEQGVCLATCQDVSVCGLGEACLEAAGVRHCAPWRCLLSDPADAGSLDPDRSRGHLADSCDARGGLCATKARCPVPLYCAADRPGVKSGHCEWPVPTVVNPLILEVFNTDMAEALNVAPMASTAALYGVRYHFALGDSFFTKDAPRARQRIKQAVVVGFSARAPELGVAAPLAMVRHFNARHRGREATKDFDAVVVECSGNEVVAEVIAAAERDGLALSRRSRVARTFGTVVFLIWLALVLLALVVLAVAAINIAHTLVMLVHERRREIAILRAIGASACDIFLLILGEAIALGLVGGLLGWVLARGAALAVDAAGAELLAGVPLVPDAFFTFPWWSLPLALLVATVFCTAGSLAPARRATRLDPATVLSQA